jgi:hypothetical protein
MLPCGSIQRAGFPENFRGRGSEVMRIRVGNRIENRKRSVECRTFGRGCGTPDIINGNPILGSGGSREIQLGFKLPF